MGKNLYTMYMAIQNRPPHLWKSGTAVKADRREVPGSIPCRSSLPIHSEILGFFSETRVNVG